ncbi:hypothetical protein EVAR_4163_1 [Eumeta japonica]|uniref:Uncharacterized protein n=1 Tax=Eumeta variegata TaxID=151549 RepID=A0A4C1TJC7_EUMVA|nr:hypothetical protein EVAR_4163_1 [Eumeta japonica]
MTSRRETPRCGLGSIAADSQTHTHVHEPDCLSRFTHQKRIPKELRLDSDMLGRHFLQCPVAALSLNPALSTPLSLSVDFVSKTETHATQDGLF